MRKLTTTVAAASAIALLGVTAATATPTTTGPSSSQGPYLVRTVSGVVPTALLTVGDRAANGYRMVGIADGLGTYDNGDGTFTVLMNHELRPDVGTVRAHGSKGAFVSKWTIDKETLAVRAGEDLIKRVYTSAIDGTWTQSTTALNRFCSADLPDQSAFYNPASGKGTQHRIFMDGEEAGAEGRAFGHVVEGPDAGSSYELPALGNASWENVVAMPGAGDTTVTVGLDDSAGGQIYVYVGEKRSTGNDVEKAGLSGGKLYGLKIDGVATETDATTVPSGGASFSLVEVPGAAGMTGAELETASNALGISKMARPEDGSWDPSDASGFYFATTAAFNGISRLWHLGFSDVADVTDGGKASIPVASPPHDATKSSAEQAGPRMLDNLTVNDRGQVLLQEDPGPQEYLAGVFQYDAADGETVRIARHDPARFSTGSPRVPDHRRGELGHRPRSLPRCGQVRPRRPGPLPHW